jgi:hypothetical protein
LDGALRLPVAFGLSVLDLDCAFRFVMEVASCGLPA